MKPSSDNFFDVAVEALHKPSLRRALEKVESYSRFRADSVAALPEFDRLRDDAERLKNHTLERLDFYLEQFEAQQQKMGGHVHWCVSPEDARNTILEICRDTAGSGVVTRGKSMVSEEIGLNEFLTQHGYTPVETDVGEHILQLAGQPPSHIVAPAVHLTTQEVSKLFEQNHEPHTRGSSEDPSSLVEEARTVLRRKFFSAKVGITGANILVAETGTCIIVTNEGNGDLTRLLAQTHVVLTTIDKVVPTMEDATTLLRLLARSSMAKPMTVYTTVLAGPHGSSDSLGPREQHVVLLDNGRSSLLGSPVQDVLRCIRCGACLNHCPIYLSVGGHAYGWVYPGPIGAALVPALLDLEQTHHLPAASTLCGRCEEVCPVRIPIPKLLLHWRAEAHARRVTPRRYRWPIAAWGFFASRYRLYRLAAAIAVMVLSWFGRKSGFISRFPLAKGWTQNRELPVPQGHTFATLWRRRPRK